MPADEASARRATSPTSPGFAATLPLLGFGGSPATSDVPVTIAWGARDRLLIPRQADAGAPVLPGAEHLCCDGCGHVPTWDDPEQVAGACCSPARALHRPIRAPRGGRSRRASPRLRRGATSLDACHSIHAAASSRAPRRAPSTPRTSNFVVREGAAHDLGAMADNLEEGFVSYRTWTKGEWEPPVARRDAARHDAALHEGRLVVASSASPTTSRPATSWPRARGRRARRAKLADVARLTHLFVRRDYWGSGLADLLHDTDARQHASSAATRPPCCGPPSAPPGRARSTSATAGSRPAGSSRRQRPRPRAHRVPPRAPRPTARRARRPGGPVELSTHSVEQRHDRPQGGPVDLCTNAVNNSPRPTHARPAGPSKPKGTAQTDPRGRRGGSADAARRHAAGRRRGGRAPVAARVRRGRAPRRRGGRRAPAPASAPRRR